MLRPEALDDLGLASALRVLGERVAEHSELEVDVHVQPGLPEFGGDAELVLYRVAQEALTNVARHAGAAPRRGPARALRRPPAARGRRRRPRASRASGARGRRRARDARARGADRRHAAARAESARRRACHPRAARRMTSSSTPGSCSPTTTRSSAAACGSCSRASPTCASSPRRATAPRRSSAGMHDDVDLAVLDISMPRMTGLQAARELTSRRADLRVLILSHARQRAVPVRGAAGRRLRLRAQERRRPRPRRGLPGDDARRAVPVPGRRARA